MAERAEKKKEVFACLHLKVTASTYQHIYNKDPLTSCVFSLYKNWSLIGSYCKRNFTFSWCEGDIDFLKIANKGIPQNVLTNLLIHKQIYFANNPF